MTTTEELACVYAALILQDDDVAITGEKIQTLLKAAKVDVEPFWPGLFAKAIDGVDVKGLITNIGSGTGAGPATVSSVVPTDEKTPAAEEKAAKKEVKEDSESEEDMGFGLFD